MYNIKYIANYCYGTSMSGIELRNETLVVERNPNHSPPSATGRFR